MDCEASEGLYGGAEGAFGTAGGSGGGEDAGSCPAASPGSPDECAGAVSTCWSPGQRDTDCPGNGLCCVSNTPNTGSRDILDKKYDMSIKSPDQTLDQLEPLLNPSLS